MRAAIHLLKTVTKPKPDARIYISEQTTHLYQYFLKNYPNTVGSEYLGDKYKPGEINESGIRNEDFTNLSFSDNEFDLVLSFEVFEHIPNFINAFSESLRTLKPGGHLIFTVPFNMNSKSNLVRAMIKNGIVEHIHPPEYHGDPVNSSEGCLCFYHFGWEVLEQLKTTGFEDVNAMSFYSKKFGYLGGEQLFFVAEKSKCENSLIKEYEDLKQNNLIAENV
jgi:SAM-dependent methyltransferase